MASHVTPIRTYVAVFLALMVLTALTVGAEFVDFGVFGDTVTLLIAFTKASLVVWIFMHVRSSAPLSKLSVVSGILWLVILFGLTLSDYLTRGL